MKRRMSVFCLILVIAASLPALTGCVKVVKIGEEGKYTGNAEFNAGDDVAQIWESGAMPELNEKAVELKDFLTEAGGNLASLADKYGKYSMGTSGEINYVVKGTGTVTEVNTESRAGYVKVSLDGYEGPETVKLQIGPVYKGSSVRDSLDFIKFGDYKNQQDWAAISQNINKLIDETVVQPADPASLQEKSISFTGAFTVNGNEELLITPVVLKVQ
ncbi:DUF2291 domain-containing protein [Clostridium sp. Marseille-P2415]|uniref:DUF2291 domain-containing protein n=1 Tax=Clostridium sp. Marseille-P2415 TaxID=1805471 RepID=UPI0009886B84|nr:DUF2291 domain-containing protein [Clostridium sp. Marseille-P2415]